MSKRITRTLMLATAMAVTPLAIAQSAPTPAPRAPHFRLEQGPFSLPSERIEARLAYLKTALKITGTQEQQWNAFAEVMRKHARERDEQVKSWRSAMHDRMHQPKPNAIERLERQQSIHAAAVVRLNDLLAAAKPLYAALSPEQKQVADEVLAPHRPFGRGFRRMG